MLPVVAPCLYLFLALLPDNRSKLRPPADRYHTRRIPKVIAPPKVIAFATQVEIATAMGKFVATKVIGIIAKNPSIKLIHIFTHVHDGGKPSEECDVGAFSNRGGFYSPLKRTKQLTTTQSSLSLSPALLA